MDRMALLIIDWQNDYFPGGRMELEGALAAATNAGVLLAEFRRRGILVVHVQHVADRSEATFFAPGTPGVEIHELVRPAPSEAVVVKHTPNSFHQTDLLPRLRDAGVTTLVVCGAMSHMCVDSTVRAAFDHGFQCTVIEDACATRTLTRGDVQVPAGMVHAAFMAALAQRFASVTTTRAWIGK